MFDGPNGPPAGPLELKFVCGVTVSGAAGGFTCRITKRMVSFCPAVGLLKMTRLV